jgi:hypothetical protein
MPKKKPSGINTVLEVGHKGVKQHQTEMPTAKDEAERKLIEIFLASAPDLPKHGLVVQSTKQNAENDFDFTLKVSTGDRYLELVEFAPFDFMKQGGYAGAPNSFKVGDLVDYLLATILTKAEHYAGHQDIPLILLVHVTHFGFLPSKSVIALAQIAISRISVPFEHIYLLAPIDMTFGPVWHLHPVPPNQLPKVNEGALRNNELTNSDLREAQAVDGGVSISIAARKPKS